MAKPPCHPTRATSTLARLDPSPLTLSPITLVSYAVLQKAISLEIKTPYLTPAATQQIRELAQVSGTTYPIPGTLGRLHLPLGIISVTSAHHSIVIRCRTPRHRALADELFPLASSTPLTLQLGNQSHPSRTPVSLPSSTGPNHDLSLDALNDLLHRAADRTGIRPETLLKQLTMFERSNKTIYPGCSHVNELSPRQRTLVAQRLHALP